MVHRLDVVILYIVAIPSNNIIWTRTRIEISYDFISSVLTCAISGHRLFTCVPIHGTIAGTRCLVVALPN